MKLRGREAESFVAKPARDIWAAVCFGEDDGIAADAAATLLKSWSGKAPLDVTLLEEDDIRKEPALLFDALEAVSLLGDARAVKVRVSGDKISALLAEAIALGDTSPDRMAAKLVVIAPGLQTKSKLRSSAEAAKYTACLQFFEDDEGGIRARAETALKREGALADPAALDAFIGDLPGHRALANSEIEKLALYARGLGRSITRDDVSALAATELEHSTGDVIARVLSGDTETALAALDRLFVAGTSPISVLRSLQFETQRMLDAHEKIANGMSAPGKSLRPPVWDNEWPAFRARLKTWPPRALMRVTERVYDAERQAKLGGATAEPVVRVLLADLCRYAASAR